MKRQQVSKTVAAQRSKASHRADEPIRQEYFDPALKAARKARERRAK